MKVKKYSGLKKKQAVYGYLFILPFIIGFIAFMLMPICKSIYMSFCNVDLSGGTVTYIFQAFKNYNRAVAIDPEFNGMLVDEGTKMFVNSLAIMVFSLFVALVINQKFRGRTFVRAVFFLPLILSSGVLVKLETDNSLMSMVVDYIKEYGEPGITQTLQELLRLANVGTRAFDEVFAIVEAIDTIALSSGIQIIIFLSGLQSINTSMYEAADIEGCTAWEKLWKITFPSICPLIIVNWVYTVIDFFMKTDNAVIEKLKLEMVTNLNYGFASAMSWLYFILCILMVAITTFIISKLTKGVSSSV